MNDHIEEIIGKICEKDLRYKGDAYIFVLQALHFTQENNNRMHHVTGVELLDGIKELMKEEFGPLSITVLAYWGVQSTEDFGNIVFNLVKHRVLTKQDDDTFDSFRDGYDFQDAFNREYREELEKKIRDMRL